MKFISLFFTAIFLSSLQSNALLHAQDSAVARGSTAPSYAGFEGRPVSKVEIAVAPGKDPERVRALISLKPGQPFSGEELRKSVTAIQSSGEFPLVQASIELDVQGVRILILVQPVFHIGLISFPGANTKFSYTSLLQAADIQLDSAFTADVLPARERALETLFAKQGYFQPSVSSRIEPDEAHQLVNIIFDCDLGKRAKIGKIVMQGVSEQEAAQLRATLNSLGAKLSSTSVKSGQAYSLVRINKGLDHLRTHYRKLGRLSPKLEVETKYDPATNRADLDLRVAPGPLLIVRVEGGHLWGRTQRKLIPIFQEGSVDQDLVNEGVRNLVNYFQSKSFFEVAVTADTANESDRLVVTFHVQKGKRHRVSHILFTNNKYFSDPELAEKIVIKKERFPFYRGKYSDGLLKQSTNSLIALYKNEGFSSVRIVPAVTDPDPRIDVEFVITEGPQDKVKSLNIVNSEGPVVESTLGKHLQLSAGKPFSQHHLDDDRNQILARYLNRGYPDAVFEAATHPAVDDPHLFEVTYHITEGQLVTIRDVVLLGTEHARPDFVRKITQQNVREAEPLSQGKLFQSESDLYALGIFDWASVAALESTETPAEQLVLVRVHESKRNSLDVGVGFEVLPRNGNLPVGAVAVPGLPGVSLGDKFSVSQKSFIGPRFSMQYSRHDIRGRAETAAIGFVFSRLDQRGTFTYADPDLRGTRWSSLFSVTAERTTENPIFTAAIGQAAFQVERQLGKKKTQKIVTRYSYRRTDLTNLVIPDLVLPQDQRVKLSTVYGEYVRDTRDKPLDAHRGQFQSLSLGISPKIFGSSADFIRFVGQTSFYRPVKPWLTWANNFRLGLAPPFAGSDVPLSERFFTGGPDTLRGFPINGAGPQRPVQVCSNPADTSTCTIISVPVGGQMLAIINSEARFPIKLKRDLGGVIFYDGGNVYRNINARQFVDNYTNTVGIGVRYNTKVGPIRIDIGQNLNPAPGVKATQYFITLGQAF